MVGIKAHISVLIIVILFKKRHLLIVLVLGEKILRAKNIICGEVRSSTIRLVLQEHLRRIIIVYLITNGSALRCSSYH